MKIITVIGDIHGVNFWKEVIKQNPETDKFIVTGDYFDSFRVPQNEQLYNFLELIEQKNFIFLLGNHDLQYYFYQTAIFDIVRCSGFYYGLAFDIRRALIDNIHKLKVCHIEDGFLFSHAGLSQKYLNKYSDEININNLDLLNKYIENPLINEYLFDVSYLRGGSKEFGGIFWADKKETQNDQTQFKQIIGHTDVKDIEFHNNNIYVDSFQYHKKYLNIYVDNDNSIKFLTQEVKGEDSDKK